MGKAINSDTHTLIKCECCGKLFDVYVSEFKRRIPKYCSGACYHRASYHPEYHQGICKNCGKMFTKKRHIDRTFCSLKCSGEYRRKQPKRVTVGKDGYRYIWLSDGSSIKEHRFIMEQFIGRKLKPNECVHHIDFNRQNNDINNLLLMTRGEHSRLHREIEKKQGKKFFGRE